MVREESLSAMRPDLGFGMEFLSSLGGGCQQVFLGSLSLSLARERERERDYYEFKIGAPIAVPLPFRSEETSSKIIG